MNRARTAGRLAALALALAAAGAGASPSWFAGWREGVVVAVGEGDPMQARFALQCADVAARPRQAPVLLATVRWTRMGRPRWRTARVAAEAGLVPGDRVYVNVQDCEAEALRRTEP